MWESPEDRVEKWVKDLLWTRRYHLRLIKDIEAKLRQISKRYNIIIPIEDDP